MLFFFLSIRLRPGSTRTDTLLPYTTLFRAPLELGARRRRQLMKERDMRGERVTFGRKMRGAQCVEMALVRRTHRSSDDDGRGASGAVRSEEHTSELQSLMRISYAVFCLKKKKYIITKNKLSTTKKNINNK